ncbi:MAG: acetyl-CoA carboxylase, carboxyltransferase subunit beta [Flavobacteriales bacterium]
MGWFKRIREGITTSTRNKKETPEGLWYKCPNCRHVMPTKDHENNVGICEECGYHEKISGDRYFQIFFDKEKYREVFMHMFPSDPLNFEDTKKYTERIRSIQKKTGLDEAIKCATGKIEGRNTLVATMDFRFIGGSMGSVVGEKISKSIDHCIKHAMPLVIVSKSGGARMMEAGYSLMQMAKTSAKLTQMADNRLPYISVLTDPTTGGVTASFAMLGDANIAEEGALIGFAGPRVIKETIGRDLPEGFQRSEFLKEHGFLDMIVKRKELKEKTAFLIDSMMPD